MSMKNERAMDPPTTFKRPDVTEPVCKKMKIDQSVNQPQYVYPEFSHDSKLNEVLNTFKSNLREKFQCLYPGTSKQRNPTLLNEIYTDLNITQIKSGEAEDTPIKCNDIFKPLPAKNKNIRSVMTKGVAGIGKTVSVQKFILDWAEEKENQDVHLIFPLPFREINLLKDKTLSLLDLLHLFFPEIKEMEIFSDEYKVLFIFDGLDECRLSLYFHSRVKFSEVSESTSVEVMLTNLIKGNLFPSALIWITSRPAAADLIPSECVDRVTEVRGFSDPQKEEYFRKRISDECLSDQIISHLKSSRSLFIMCHIPVFCWISGTVLEGILREAKRREIPKTLTQMYTHFLIIQKDYEKNKDMVFKMCKLAFEQIMKGNLIFYDEDLRECGIDVSEASVYSGLCTQIFREEFGLCQRKVYSFFHPSIQEHLAALHVHLSFMNNNISVLTAFKMNQSCKPSIIDLYHRAIDETVKSKNGHLDLFLRFFLGLSLQSNQNLIPGLRLLTCYNFQINEKAMKYIKEKIRKNPSPEKSINLLQCLNELGDVLLMREIQQYLTSTTKNKTTLSSYQWSAIVSVMLTSGHELNKFNMNPLVKGINAESLKVLKELLPVICESRSVQLISWNITDEGCVALSSALRSNPSHLRELNLGNNKLKDSGVKLLTDVLKNPDCKLQILKLNSCCITVEGCAALTSALRSNPSHLRDLNLSQNNLGDSGVKLISDVLKNPDCKLEKLWLNSCYISAEGCAALTSALRSNPSHLRELNLSQNNLGDLGIEHLSDLLEHPNCKLEKLWLCFCNITDEGCVALSSALTSNPSHLRELSLCNNKLGDLGVKLLSAVLENTRCKLEILKLSACNITDEGCFALTSALRLNPSHLTDLFLSHNNLGDLGMKLISDLTNDLNYKQKKLRIIVKKNS
nr:NACHT, LRR and PYD domains-containing protein 3-like [Misgurnus anguillicaudatus]XP_055053317.1 NACHT, LRR and PYD domains-containing protein 3-like [Misgurnus anguillicaudatus]